MFEREKSTIISKTIKDNFFYPGDLEDGFLMAIDGQWCLLRKKEHLSITEDLIVNFLLQIHIQFYR